MTEEFNQFKYWWASFSGLCLQGRTVAPSTAFPLWNFKMSLLWKQLKHHWSVLTLFTQTVSHCEDKLGISVCKCLSWFEKTRSITGMEQQMKRRRGRPADLYPTFPWHPATLLTPLPPNRFVPLLSIFIFTPALMSCLSLCIPLLSLPPSHGIFSFFPLFQSLLRAASFCSIPPLSLFSPFYIPPLCVDSPLCCPLIALLWRRFHWSNCHWVIWIF